MDIVSLIIWLIAGAAGGNAAATVIKNANLGTTGNSIVGAVGGVICGYLLERMMGMPAADAAAVTMSIGTIIQDLIAGGVGGGVLAVIAGLVKQATAKA